MRARALREAQVEAQRLLERRDAALAADAELLDDEERAAIDALRRPNCATSRARRRSSTRSKPPPRRSRPAPRNSPRAAWTRAFAARWPAASCDDVVTSRRIDAPCGQSTEMIGSTVCLKSLCCRTPTVPGRRRDRRRRPARSICDTLLDHGIEIEHACEKSCACTTCHVIVREGFDSLEPPRKKRKICSTRPGGSSRLAPVVPGDRARRRGSGGRDPEVHDQPREGKSLTKEDAS